MVFLSTVVFADWKKHLTRDNRPKFVPDYFQSDRHLAEGVGFEPTRHFCPLVFKTSSIGRSDSPPPTILRGTTPHPNNVGKFLQKPRTNYLFKPNSRTLRAQSLPEVSLIKGYVQTGFGSEKNDMTSYAAQEKFDFRIMTLTSCFD